MGADGCLFCAIRLRKRTNLSVLVTSEPDELSIPGQLARSKSAERCGSPAATSKGHWPFEAPTEPTGETSSLRRSRTAVLPSGCDALRHILLGIIWRIAGGRFAAPLHRVAPTPRTALSV